MVSLESIPAHIERLATTIENFKREKPLAPEKAKRPSILARYLMEIYGTAAELFAICKKLQEINADLNTRFNRLLDEFTALEEKWKDWTKCYKCEAPCRIGARVFPVGPELERKWICEKC